eukprot:TRINITY_DN5863_c0_g1_i1.p1 TRINITY_DN5863_c0_g1~~TRINITY_DN5863_c0_g1_i1.p1  ORF type:complete len:539 (-),score=71.79 TRINITY_DN5863_c0_g1_i1:720-2315(-)
MREKMPLAQFLKFEEIGSGTFGIVYRGVCRATAEFVAIKEVRLGRCPQDQLARLQKEFKTFQRLSHPNIVRYIAFAVAPHGVASIVMEYLPGGSLDKMLGRVGPLPEPVVAHYTKQMLEGLQYLHEHNIVHRDIKPLNVLLDCQGTVKLADFGACRVVSERSARSGSYTTPIYTAPEVIRNMTVSKAGDIWSIGCTVQELLTNKRPWSHLLEGDAPVLSLLFKIGTNGISPLCGDEEISPDAVEFLQNCYRIEPTARPTADDLLKLAFPRIAKPDAIETLLSKSERIEISRANAPACDGGEDGTNCFSASSASATTTACSTVEASTLRSRRSVAVRTETASANTSAGHEEWEEEDEEEMEVEEKSHGQETWDIEKCEPEFYPTASSSTVGVPDYDTMMDSVSDISSKQSPKSALLAGGQFPTVVEGVLPPACPLRKSLATMGVLGLAASVLLMVQFPSFRQNGLSLFLRSPPRPPPQVEVGALCGRDLFAVRCPVRSLLAHMVHHAWQNMHTSLASSGLQWTSLRNLCTGA